MTKRTTDRDFQKLAAVIKGAIAENEGLIGDQKEQVELLLSLERKFRKEIRKYARATVVYAKFIEFVHSSEGLGNILSAQSYFREVLETFNKKISRILKNKDAEALMDFDINYLLVKFIVDNWEDPLPPKIDKIYKELIESRRILIENNLPLAINRAKIFFQKTPRSHLALLDLIDICVCGLIVGVDKYATDYTTVWRSVGIGRMVGFMIEEYSKSFIRLYPSDKKILYRANALRYRMNLDNMTELTEAVNESFEKDRNEGRASPKHKITEIQIRTLLNSTGYTSADTPIDADGNDDGYNNSTIYDYTPNQTCLAEEAENKDILEKVVKNSNILDILERKIIKLKGVDL